MSTHRHTHSHAHHHHHHGGEHSIDDTPPPPPKSANTLGALLFYTYILLALFLTTKILRHLRRQASTNSSSPTRHPAYTHSKLLLLCTLAFISFATLSYHMLQVLIASYTAYSTFHLSPISSLARMHLTSGMLVVPSMTSVVAFGIAVAGQVWQWSVSSTLFVSFAEDLVKDRGAQCWSFASLVGSLGVMVWMGERGRRQGVKGLGWYFALAQILPVGFTLWLFLMGVLLGGAGYGGRGRGRRVDARAYWTTGVLFGGYCLLLQVLPSYVGKKGFVPLVLAVRLLLGLPLILPYLLLMLGLLGENEFGYVAVTAPTGTLIRAVGAAIAMKVGYSHFTRAAGWWQALNGSPAVSALGYDLVIGLVGLVVFWIVGGLSSNDLPARTPADGALQRKVDERLHKESNNFAIATSEHVAESTGLQQSLDQKLRSRRG